MSTEQIAVRLPQSLLSDLDQLVQSGVYASRAAGVRAGIKALMNIERQRKIDQSMVDGYTRVPPTDAEEGAAIASLRAAIADEPW